MKKRRFFTNVLIFSQYFVYVCIFNISFLIKHKSSHHILIIYRETHRLVSLVLYIFTSVRFELNLQLILPNSTHTHNPLIFTFPKFLARNSRLFYDDRLTDRLTVAWRRWVLIKVQYSFGFFFDWCKPIDMIRCVWKLINGKTSSKPVKKNWNLIRLIFFVLLPIKRSLLTHDWGMFKRI